MNCTLHLILFFSLFLCYRTPSNEELFERFLVDVAWRHYRTYVTKGSTEKLSRGTGSTKSMWLANYLVTNALLRDKRGRLAVKERLKEIQERHHRKTEDEEDEEENKVLIICLVPHSIFVDKIIYKKSFLPKYFTYTYFL